jgi:DNA-binding response OmpR family regulator
MMTPIDSTALETHTAIEATSVVVVADDLIWASRLRAAVERADAAPLVAKSLGELSSALTGGEVGAVLVDLNGRAYDGVEAVRTATVAGRTVLAVGQHEDLELRRRALDAGARRVLSYNKLFNDGPKVVTALLEGKL